MSKRAGIETERVSHWYGWEVAWVLCSCSKLRSPLVITFRWFSEWILFSLQDLDSKKIRMTDEEMINGDSGSPVDIDEDLHSRQASKQSPLIFFFENVSKVYDVWLPSLSHNLHVCLLQLAVYGKESMRRMATANVLIIGLNGLGCEIGMLSVFRYIIFQCSRDHWNKNHQEASN